MSRPRIFFGLLVAAGLVFLGADPGGTEDHPDIAWLDAAATSLEERRLVQGLLDTSRGRLGDALGNLDDLVRRQPDFQLAHVVRGDLLLALAGRVGSFAAGAPPEAAGGFQQEARARLRRYLDSPSPTQVPAEVLRLPPSTPAAIAVDLESYRLYVVERRDGRLRRSRDFYVSIGKQGSDKRFEGDEKTPVGVYWVTRFIPGDQLPDLYGVGAFPISYPNGWDRSLGRTGSGIWIHGTESTSYSRPPLSSLGCVTLANADFERLAKSVELKSTPVVVANRLQWAEAEALGPRADEVAGAIESWRSDWESLDTRRYLTHYADEFRTAAMTRRQFASHKQRVNSGKRWIRVGVSELGLYGYPGEPKMVVADFRQRYESDGFRGSTRKRQYWRRGPDGWRIVFEEKA